MTSTLNTAGRLGNQIIRNLAVSLIAEKHNLFVNYSFYDKIQSLGINLFIGTNKYNNGIVLNNNNYLSILNQELLNSNLNPQDYFQTKEITNLLHKYLSKNENKSKIVMNNPFKERYNQNNDLFIHIRLTDAVNFNPGIHYYLKAIDNVEFNQLFISTDDSSHSIIKILKEKYPNLLLIEKNEIETFQFASTCKNIILSNGSFSAIIGYLSFYSNIYYPRYDESKRWCGDMFSIEGWNKIDF
jgi:hypothetical protein